MSQRDAAGTRLDADIYIERTKRQKHALSAVQAGGYAEIWVEQPASAHYWRSCGGGCRAPGPLVALLGGPAHS